MTFWDNLVRYCARKSTTPTAVGHTIGVSAASVSGWKQGAIPREATLQKLADYFDITVDQLLFGEQGNPLLRQPLALTEEERSIIVALRDQPEMITAVRRLLGMPEKS